MNTIDSCYGKFVNVLHGHVVSTQISDSFPIESVTKQKNKN